MKGDNVKKGGEMEKAKKGARDDKEITVTSVKGKGER